MIAKLLLLLCVGYLAFIPLKNYRPAEDGKQQPPTNQKEQRMELGNLSDRLAVKDIEASRSLYEKFGFKVFMGNAAQKWLIMKNGEHVIGLFQGMFEKNILTFNPGW